MENKENTSICQEGFRTRVRFSSEDDLALLREVVNINPLIEPSKWEEVKHSLYMITGKNFTIRSLKDHVSLLLEAWKQKDMINLAKSGVEEVYSEKDNLLEEVSNICREFKVSLKNQKGAVVSRNKKIINLGKDQRDKAASIFFGNTKTHTTNIATCDNDNINENVTVNRQDYHFILKESPNNGDQGSQMEQGNQNINKTPTTSVLKPHGLRKQKNQPLRRNALNFIEEKSIRDHDLKKRELDLEERKLMLQEKKLQLEEQQFELEKEERRFRLQLEEKRLLQQQSTVDNLQKVIDQQKTLIDILIKKMDS